MDNLIEQLRARANSLAGAGSTDLLTQAADTLAAQARLLDLAGTMAEPASAVSMLIGGDTWKRMQEAARAFSAAQAEYQTTGTVPCPECDEARRQLAERESDFKALSDEYDVVKADNADLRRQLANIHNSEAVRQSIGQKVYQERDDLRRVRAANNVIFKVLEAERDDLRRQLEQANTELEDYRTKSDGQYIDWYYTLVETLGIKPGGSVVDAVDDLRRQLTEAQALLADELGRRKNLGAQVEALTADNAALVEALSKYGEHTGGDSETGNSDETSCGCGLWNIRAQPHPGAGLLAELAALRKVERIGRSLGDYNADTEFFKACDILDAIRNREDDRNA